MFGVQEPEPGASRAQQAQHCQMPALPEHWREPPLQPAGFHRTMCFFEPSNAPATPLLHLPQHPSAGVRPKSATQECPRCGMSQVRPARPVTCFATSTAPEYDIAT